MKLLQILALCVTVNSQVIAQDCTPIRPIYSPCASAQNNIGGLCLQPNKAWFVFETCWLDAGPRTISATLNGQTVHSVYRTIYQPGIDSVSVEYFPVVPGGSHNDVNVTFAIFNPGEYIAYYESNDEPMTARVYHPPTDFHIEGLPYVNTTDISITIQSDDWNVNPTMFNDCGYKHSDVLVQLVRCADNTVISTQVQTQSSALPDEYTFVFSYVGPVTALRFEAQLIHTEDSLLGEFGPSMTRLIATDETNCFFAGDLSTETPEVTTDSPDRLESLVITDVNGHIVRTGTVSSKQKVSLPADLAVGTYLVRVGNLPTYRVVKCTN